ncbi:MAG TPA: NAD(P)H-hydrate dehydratase [Thermoanaerobaculia bacterium]|nr:NAD(P)H-hydrate dehydratase [Thermoanaerobaculia bacterium]
MRVLTTEQMRRFDRWAIEQAGIPEPVLMENAALGVADAVGDRYPGVHRVDVVCGPGNNGGDGLAIARQLLTRGYSVAAWLATPASQLGQAAAVQLATCRTLGVPVEEIGDSPWRPRGSLVIEALFGTGLSRPLAGRLARLATEITECGAPVVAVDLPAGLDAGRADPPGPHVRAELTVTFGALKVAHVLEPSASACGETIVADLGLPLVELDEDPPRLSLLEAGELAGWLPERRAASHKGDYGHLLVVAGSWGMSGAATLCASSALRAGAGLVTVAAPESIRGECAVGVREAMTLGLGDAGCRALAPAHVDRLLEAAAGRDAVALGPGVGRHEETGETVRRLALELAAPLVLDADGLAAFAARLGELRERRAATVLTPHPGELARLLSADGADSAAVVQADRLGAARRAADHSGAVVVLKGHRTVVAEPGGEAAVCPTGNPGMATGGTGDVLTGVIGALLAQGFEAFAAARLGVFWHGLAGDLAAQARGQASLVAGDLVDALSAARQTIEAER